MGNIFLFGVLWYLSSAVVNEVKGYMVLELKKQICAPIWNWILCIRFIIMPYPIKWMNVGA